MATKPQVEMYGRDPAVKHGKSQELGSSIPAGNSRNFSRRFPPFLTGTTRESAGTQRKIPSIFRHPFPIVSGIRIPPFPASVSHRFPGQDCAVSINWIQSYLTTGSGRFQVGYRFSFERNYLTN